MQLSPQHDPALAVADLSVDLSGQRVLSNIDLAVNRGEILAMLGANGSGKSTLIRAIAGVLPAVAGSVSIMGKPGTSRAVKHNLGYVPQRLSHDGGVSATAAEVVATGLLSSRKLWNLSVAKAVTDALDAVQIRHLYHRPVSEMSGGQHQRVLVARALVRKPRLLLLDEPLAGVDLPSQKVFADLVQSLAAQGSTVIVVLHELGTFASLITRSVVLRDGSIVHDGPLEKLSHSDPDAGHDHTETDDRGFGRDLCL